MKLAVFFSLLLLLSPFQALASTAKVSDLLQEHANSIQKLKQVARQKVGSSSLNEYPYNNDVFFLRFCLDHPEETRDAALVSTLMWRLNDGKALSQAAASVVRHTAAAKDHIDNEAVLKAAPHAEAISKYISPASIMTTNTNKGDLVYCIRAAMIDDNAMMKDMSVDQVAEFFLYLKEVNAAVANQRSLLTDRLVKVITANDLSGVKVVGGSSAFRQALSSTSKKAAMLYPATAGPTLLLNVPRFMNALVNVFSAVMPSSVSEKVKFEQGLLKDVSDLNEIAPGGKSRSAFLIRLEQIVYKA